MFARGLRRLPRRAHNLAALAGCVLQPALPELVAPLTATHARLVRSAVVTLEKLLELQQYIRHMSLRVKDQLRRSGSARNGRARLRQYVAPFRADLAYPELV